MEQNHKNTEDRRAILLVSNAKMKPKSNLVRNSEVTGGFNYSKNSYKIGFLSRMVPLLGLLWSVAIGCGEKKSGNSKETLWQPLPLAKNLAEGTEDKTEAFEKTESTSSIMDSTDSMDAGTMPKINSMDGIKKTEALQVGILIYPEVELLDFTGPAEVFSNARGFEVFTISAGEKSIVTKNGTLSVNADYSIADYNAKDAPEPDILVVPGAPMDVVDRVGNQEVLDWIKKTEKSAQLTMSVCTGALLLGRAGLLDGKTATSHLGAIDKLQEMIPKARFVNDARFVEDGKILTTAGVSAGIDGALHVVEKFQGLKSALFVTGIMEYDYWNPEDGLVIGENEVPAGIREKDQQDSAINREKNATENRAPFQENNATGNRATVQENGASDQESKTTLQKNSAMILEKSPTSSMEKTLDSATKDPVCGMGVSAGASKYHIEYKGKEYHFCSPSCKKLFENNRELYSAE